MQRHGSSDSAAYHMQVLHIGMQEGRGIEVGQADWGERLCLSEGLIGSDQVGQQQQVMWVQHMGP